MHSNNNIKNCVYHSQPRNALNYSHNNKIPPTSKVKATSTLNYECRHKSNNVCHPHLSAHKKNDDLFTKSLRTSRAMPSKSNFLPTPCE